MVEAWKEPKREYLKDTKPPELCFPPPIVLP